MARNLARTWLGLIAVSNIVLTPVLAFSVTYLIEVESSAQGIAFNLRPDLIPFILSASLAYGAMALVLALGSGAYVPIWVVDRGGWRAAVGLTSDVRGAARVRHARHRYQRSPHGQMVQLVRHRHQGGQGLIAIHGGLFLLAIPMQLMLITIPLLVVLALPDGAIRSGRFLEAMLFTYLITLIGAMRTYPSLAQHLMGVASITRRWLISMSRLSWFAPAMVLWLIGRLASMVMMRRVDADLATAFHDEQMRIEGLLGLSGIPETAFLDLLTALAVLPMSTFTTLAVWSGGLRSVPNWLDAPSMRSGESRPTSSGHRAGTVAVSLGAAGAAGMFDPLITPVTKALEGAMEAAEERIGAVRESMTTLGNSMARDEERSLVEEGTTSLFESGLFD